MELIVLVGGGLFWYLRSKIGLFRVRHERLGIAYERSTIGAFLMIKNGTHVSMPNKFARYLNWGAFVQDAIRALPKSEAHMCAQFVLYRGKAPQSMIDTVNQQIDWQNALAEAIYDEPLPTSKNIPARTSATA
jgi:hypothetical protein